MYCIYIRRKRGINIMRFRCRWMQCLTVATTFKRMHASHSHPTAWKRKERIRTNIAVKKREWKTRYDRFRRFIGSLFWNNDIVKHTWNIIEMAVSVVASSGAKSIKRTSHLRRHHLLILSRIPGVWSKACRASQSTPEESVDGTAYTRTTINACAFLFGRFHNNNIEFHGTYAVCS